jgi:DNA-binding NarL/FixJ family response regulator
MYANQQKRMISNKKLRVLAADDHDGVLQHIVSLLEVEFLVVATAKNGRAAIDCVKQHRPRVAVLDLAMPILNGIETSKELKKMPLAPAVVICSISIDPAIIAAAQQTGALGYVFKTHMSQDLVKAVKSAARGEPFVSSRWDGHGRVRKPGAFVH